MRVEVLSDIFLTIRKRENHNDQLDKNENPKSLPGPELYNQVCPEMKIGRFSTAVLVK